MKVCARWQRRERKSGKLALRAFRGASPLTQVCAQSAVRKYMRYGHQHVVTTVLYLCQNAVLRCCFYHLSVCAERDSVALVRFKENAVRHSFYSQTA